MIDWTLLAIFIPTFFVVSITPGMCMTLALTLGIQLGWRTTMWMMFGELVGVATVAIAAVTGVAAMMLSFPNVFTLFKWVGGLYLIWVGINMWRSNETWRADATQPQEVGKWALARQGFITAIANPKGWAFMISLLPPFVNPALPMVSQMTALVGIILVTEFVCLNLYAGGGRTLAKWLTRRNQLHRLNQLSGALMMMVGAWLALG